MKDAYANQAAIDSHANLAFRTRESLRRHLRIDHQLLVHSPRDGWEIHRRVHHDAAMIADGMTYDLDGYAVFGSE